MAGSPRVPTLRPDRSNQVSCLVSAGDPVCQASTPLADTENCAKPGRPVRRGHLVDEHTRLTRQLEPLRVEGLGHERSILDEEEVAGGVGGVVGRRNDLFAEIGVERADIYPVVLRAGGAGKVQIMPAIRQELGPDARLLSGGKRTERSRVPAAARHAEEPSAVREDDDVFLAPRGADLVDERAQGLHRATGQAHLPETPGDGEEPDLPSVGRPEGMRSSFGARHGGDGDGAEWPQEELREPSGEEQRECDLPTVRRDGERLRPAKHGLFRQHDFESHGQGLGRPPFAHDREPDGDTEERGGDDDGCPGASGAVSGYTLRPGCPGQARA